MRAEHPFAMPDVAVDAGGLQGCFDECLAELPAESRALILDYYQGERAREDREPATDGGSAEVVGERATEPGAAGAGSAGALRARVHGKDDEMSV